MLGNEPETPHESNVLADVQRVQAELTALLEQGALMHAGLLGGDEGAIARLQALQWVNPHLPIGWPMMPKGLVPKLTAYAKKITRVGLRWYINPLVEQQNGYNEAVTDALRTLAQEVARLEARVAGIEASLEQVQHPSHAHRPPQVAVD